MSLEGRQLVFDIPELNASLTLINAYKHHQTFDPVEVLVSHVGQKQDFRMLWELVGIGQIRAAARSAIDRGSERPDAQRAISSKEKP
jgi:hypothetical protein